MYKILTAALVLTALLVLYSNLGFAQGSASSKIEMVDAKLGKNVQDRAIVDEGTTFPVNSKVYLWLKTKGGISESVTVAWTRKESANASAADKNPVYVSSATKLAINGSPWRTWASKTVGKAGDWTVTVKDPEGNTLKTLDFKVE